MQNKTSRGFFGITITKEILENRDLTIAEKFVLGYIASFAKCCYESNARIANKLGISASSVAHTIPSLVEKGFITVEKAGNSSARRSIYVVENPVENSGAECKICTPPVQNMHCLSAKYAFSLTGVDSAKFAHKEKNKIKNKADNVKNCMIKRSQFDNAHDFEKAFYNRNTICLGAD